MHTLLRRLGSFIRRKLSLRYKFDLQYGQKKWEGMRAPEDEGRYNFIIGYVRQHFSSCRILDLGCGEGILAERLAPGDYANLLGVDFSAVAIENAKKQVKRPGAHFTTGNLDNLHIKGTYDVIIYNETLYYLRNVKKSVKAALSHLAPGGVIIVSMVDKRGRERSEIWDALESILLRKEKVKIANDSGDSWTIAVYSPLP